ncbi:MAG: RNA polymerase sigma factor [Ignavibacteriales bacterium]|nr:RNA polymerase sigma factor [Ignavibacteriales bacterium]
MDHINGNTDNDLILLTLSNSKESQKSFELLVDRYKNYVFQICYNKLKNAEDAEDAAQEVFVRAYFALKNFRFESEFKTWLTKITLNVNLTMLLSNKRKFWKSFVTSDDEADIELIYRSTITKSQEESFWGAVGSTLHKMIQAYRKVFILRYFKNFQIEQISKKITSSIGATKMKLKRAKDQFLKIFLEE